MSGILTVIGELKLLSDEINNMPSEKVINVSEIVTDKVTSQPSGRSFESDKYRNKSSVY